jgi:hypothetical protein
MVLLMFAKKYFVRLSKMDKMDRGIFKEKTETQVNETVAREVKKEVF